MRTQTVRIALRKSDIQVAETVLRCQHLCDVENFSGDDDPKPELGPIARVIIDKIEDRDELLEQLQELAQTEPPHPWVANAPLDDGDVAVAMRYFYEYQTWLYPDQEIPVPGEIIEPVPVASVPFIGWVTGSYEHAEALSFAAHNGVLYACPADDEGNPLDAPGCSKETEHQVQAVLWAREQITPVFLGARRAVALLEGDYYDGFSMDRYWPDDQYEPTLGQFSGSNRDFDRRSKKHKYKPVAKVGEYGDIDMPRDDSADGDELFAEALEEDI
jgi:hypothetical protein